MEKKLEIKNLTISFRTVNGKVQAVRKVDLELYKGETLAIVGESGSGKSVTSRAILGILASNAIVEGGEVIYEDKDLLKISEEDFHSIRGDKIAMIFQDPMSSLNPIMRIGKQLTEAMLLKNRAARRNSKVLLSRVTKILAENMDQANPSESGKSSKMIADFKKIAYAYTKLEGSYKTARENAVAALTDIDQMLLEIEKKALGKNVSDNAAEIVGLANGSVNRFVVRDEERIKQLTKSFSVLIRKGRKKEAYTEATEVLSQIKAILKEGVSHKEPDFFAMGYYLSFKDKTLPELSLNELDAMTKKILDEEFMSEFLRRAQLGVERSFRASFEKKKAAQKLLAEKASQLEQSGENLDKTMVSSMCREMYAAVSDTIDRLAVLKDSRAYTFKSSLESALDRYYTGKKKNLAEEKRFAAQTAKHDKKTAKGKDPGWTVVPRDLVDIPLQKKNIIAIIHALEENFSNAIRTADQADFQKLTNDVVEHMEELAADAVYRLTRSMAKARAIRLMDEVGIPEAAKRYTQYPFQFSGGMRQRIVIAIALSANPDILICDEPTTALDVTIQAQILELINRLKAERDLSVIFITHDLGVVANMADRISVMYAGKIVEQGTAEDIFYSPAHPYTWALLSSMPDLNTNEKLESIPGTPPNMIYPPKGDAFAERNKYAMEIDFEEQPPMFKISETHSAATWLLHPDAPKVDPPEIVTSRIKRMLKKDGESE